MIGKQQIYIWWVYVEHTHGVYKDEQQSKVAKHLTWQNVYFWRSDKIRELNISLLFGLYVIFTKKGKVIIKVQKLAILVEIASAISSNPIITCIIFRE